ncbi:RNA polymerase sigma factor [Nakamurella sp. GG22]
MTATTAAVEAVWRIESGRLVAALARITDSFVVAEDLAQDCLEVALRQWPGNGIPDHPASWLMATAKHLAIDHYRRSANLSRKLATLAQDPHSRPDGGDPMAAVDDRLDTAVPDDLLRLIFTACHPALAVDAQVALVLRTLGGLQTRDIARAFMVSDKTMGQRISRAKKVLTEQQITLELPPAADLPARLDAVLRVLYLIFSEGYAATSGDDWTRPELCSDAIRLGRVLAVLQPREPEVLGLLGLMELQASRLPARTGPNREPILLEDQDRRRWDANLIRRGLGSLRAAEDLGGGPYTVQAAIAACHAQARSIEDTDWRRVAALYTVLAHVLPTPVVAVNRAVAVGMADGPARGLELLDKLVDEPALAGYPPLPAARATFLRRLGRTNEARAEFQRAADCTSNEGERLLYRRQAGSLPTNERLS